MSRSDSPAPSSAQSPTQRPAEAVVVRTVPAPARYPCGLAWDGTRLWHSDQDAASLYAIAPQDGRVERTLACRWVRADLTHDGARLAQIGGRPKRLVLVDPADGQVTGQAPILPASGRPTGLELGPEGFWLCLRSPTVVQLRDRATMEVVREFPALGASPSGLTYAGGVVVYGDYEESVLRAMDARTGAHLATVAVPGRPTGVTWDGERVWYCDFPARSLRSLDAAAFLCRGRLTC